MSITNNLAKGLLFIDDAKDLPIVNYTNSNSPYGGYWTYTGGTQNTASQSPDNNVSIVSKGGKNAYRHYVKYRGPGGNDGQWGRGEWGLMMPGHQTMENAWYAAGISTMIDPAHAFESRRYQIAFDHKESPDDMETPFYLALLNDRYVIYGRFVNDPYVDLGKVETGVWVNWVLMRNWSTGSDGYMRFYKDGKLMWEKLGPNRDSRSGSAPICRVQHGFYKWAWYSGNPEGSGSGNTTGDLIMYTSDIKFGNQSAKLEDMLPVNTVPGPEPEPVPPTVNAGPDFFVPFGTPGVLRGTVTGTATAKKWTAPAGATLSAPAADETQITTATDGKFTVVLAAENGTAKAADSAVVNVVKANAGPDQTVASGTTVTLKGTSTANIPTTSATWSRVSGTGGTLNGSTVTGLPVGTHVFRYTVVYPSTLSVSDDVTITVTGTTTPPPTKKKSKVEVGGDLTTTIYFSDGTKEIY